MRVKKKLYLETHQRRFGKDGHRRDFTMELVIASIVTLTLKSIDGCDWKPQIDTGRAQKKRQHLIKEI